LKALGEANPYAYLPIDFPGGSKKNYATSEVYSDVCGVVAYPWLQPVWAEVVRVPDPFYGKKDEEAEQAGTENRVPNIPVINRVFGIGVDGEKAARSLLPNSKAKRLRQL